MPNHATPNLVTPIHIRSALRVLARPLVIGIAALGLTACVGSYTGPVEVTRFVAAEQLGGGAALGQGTIAIDFPEEMENQTALSAFAAAIADELSALGYEVVPAGATNAQQIAVVRTTRNPLAPASSRGPVNVGVGGSTGSFGSGVGVGIGINLGGGSRGPNVLSELSVRISNSTGESLWEGRAQQPVSINSPYADVDASARALAGALFSDFPGGNGETVTIDVDDL